MIPSVYESNESGSRVVVSRLLSLRWHISLLGPELVGLFSPDLESKMQVVSPFFRKGITMGKKLYVGNLSYDTTNEGLQAIFAPHGTVDSAQVIMDRETGRSKGFGFVEMGSDAEAQAAIAALDGQQQNGRALKVNEAKPREDRPRGGGGGGYGGGGGGGRRRF
jgi:RNA recognition motif. (a.k.a. RRM, RBD, or RNP domain)